MDPPIAIAHSRLGDFLDPLDEMGLPDPSRAVMVGRTFNGQGAASTTDAHLPGRPHMIDHRPLTGMPQSFRLMTSCNISLSNDRSATIRFSRAFSSSSWRKRFISGGISPAYFLRQL
jgi:hypothetical protein